jgi:hypothetical protein
VLLAAQPFLVASVLSGFRHATRVPAELRASSTFMLAPMSDAAPYISGVKRAGWLAVVVPTLVALTIWAVAVLGADLARRHLGIGLALSALLMETLFLKYRRVPFVSSYVASADVKLNGVMFLAALLSGSFVLAWLERLSFESATGYAVLVATLLGLAVAARVFDHATRGPATALDLDEEPVLPTQRLNLAK